MLQAKLQLPDTELQRAHRVVTKQDNQHRPIIARFVSFNDRGAVRRNISKLRGAKIFINENLCPASQAIRKDKLSLLKKRKSEGKIVYFNHTELVIKMRNGSSAATGVLLMGLLLRLQQLLVILH